METNIPIEPVDQVKTNKEKLIIFVNRIKDDISKNRKILYIIGGVFMLVLLTIILGLIFGKNSKINNTTSKSTNSPTPSNIEVTPQPPDSFGDIENKLNDLKNKIQNFDISQKRFQPPNLDFKIKF